jgi:hypothetical protein
MLDKSHRTTVAYVAPFVSYLLLTAGASKLGDYYAWGYGAAAIGVSIVCVVVLRGQQIVQPHARVALGVLVGVVGIAIWIPVSALHLESQLAEYLPSALAPPERVGFNPFEELNGPFAIGAFVTARLIGLVVLTPLAEELFWRGFLVRWIIDPDWEEVPIGQFTPRSFIVVTIAFTLAHPEWLAAALYCALLNLFLYYRRDLWSCIVAHAVSNLLLAIYAMATQTWWLW